VDKIAVSSQGPGLDDPMDQRFGRAAGFLIVDPDSMQTEYIDNGSSQVLAQGAGIQAAETVAKSGAKVVISGFVGPKAFRILQAAGIRVVHGLQNMTVRQAVELFKKGELEYADAPARPED